MKEKYKGKVVFLTRRRNRSNVIGILLLVQGKTLLENLKAMVISIN